MCSHDIAHHEPRDDQDSLLTIGLRLNGMWEAVIGIVAGRKAQTVWLHRLVPHAIHNGPVTDGT